MEPNRHNSLDDILFENKNKSYGAYYNRLTAGFDLMKSLFITVFGIGIMALVLSFTINKDEKIIDDGGVIIILDPDISNPPEDDEPLKTAAPVKKIKTVVDNKTNVTPTPTIDPDKQTEMRDNEDLSTEVSGDVASDGENTGIQTPQGGNEGGAGEVEGNDGGTEIPAQPEKKNFLPRDVTEMAIFPGCERFAGNKDKLTSCMSEQLQRELADQITDFETTAQRQGIDQAQAKVQFVIDKSGKIVEVKTVNGGNFELSKESKEALERISKRLVQKGKYIKPAKFDDGTPVNLIFTIPVKFISN